MSRRTLDVVDVCPACGAHRVDWRLPTRRCALCGQEFTGGRVDKVYCSKRCADVVMSRRYRSRKAQQ